MSKLLKNSLIYTLSYFLGMGINILLLPLYTIYLTPADFGIYSTLLVYSSIFSILFNLGIDSSIARHYFDYYSEPEKLRHYLGSVVPFAAVLALFTLGLLLAIGFLFFDPLNKIPIYPYFVLILFTAYFNLLYNIFLQLLRVMQKAVRFMAFNLSYALLTILLNVILITVFRLKILGLLYTNLAIGILGFAAGIIFLSRYITFNRNWQNIKNSYLFGLPFVPHDLANFVLRSVDIIILGYFVPMYQVGLYSIATRLTSIITLIQNSFNNSWNPVFQEKATQDPEQPKPYFSVVSSVYFLLLLVLILSVILFTKEILMIFTTKQYYDSAILIQVMAFSSVFRGIYYMTTQQLIYIKKMIYMPVATILSGSINIGLILLVVKPWGTTGVAAVSIIAVSIMAGITFIFGQKFYRIPYNYPYIVKSFILFAIALGLFFILPPLPMLALIGAKVALLALFLFACVLFRLINPAQVRLLIWNKSVSSNG
jgi:O-antigen/teichoic acid export membrane protein